MTSHFSLQNFMLIICAKVVSKYCSLPEDGQVGRSMSEGILNSEHNKIV